MVSPESDITATNCLYSSVSTDCLLHLRIDLQWYIHEAPQILLNTFHYFTSFLFNYYFKELSHQWAISHFFSLHQTHKVFNHFTSLPMSPPLTLMQYCCLWLTFKLKLGTQSFQLQAAALVVVESDEEVNVQYRAQRHACQKQPHLDLFQLIQTHSHKV